MSIQRYRETIAWQRAAGSLLATYTTAKSVLNPDALVTVPGGSSFWEVGKQIRICFAGAISNLVTTPGLINFQVKIGSVAAFDSLGIQLNATAHTTLPFWAEILLTCRALGSGTAANVMGQGIFTGKMFTFTAAQTDDLQDMPTILAPATAPAVGTGFDSTIANIIDLWAGFTISSGSNGIQIQQYQVSVEN